MKTLSQQQKKAKKKKSAYRIRNWHNYNESLVKRGSLTLWLDSEATGSWFASCDKEERRKGRPFVYSDTAIETILTVGSVYHLPLRALEGFLQSIAALLNGSAMHSCPKC